MTRCRFAPSILLVLSIALLAALPTEALAKTKKSEVCQEHNITATVGKDGVLTVTEVRTMEYKGHYTSLSFKIMHGGALLGPCEVEVQDVGEVVDGVPRSYAPASSLSAGTPLVGFYYVNEMTSSGMDMTNVDMRFDKTTEVAHFYVTYRIAGCVERWADVGELYWAFIGGMWDTDTNNAHLEVYLPAPEGSTVERGENEWAWLHNQSLVGEVRVNEGEAPPADARDANAPGTVLCDAQLVEKGKSAEVRVLFPAEWLTSMEARAKNRRPTVTAEEASRTEQADELRAGGAMASYVKAGVMAVLLAASIGLLLVGRGRSVDRQEARSAVEPCRDVPKDDHPAVFAQLVSGDATDSSALAATLMCLADQRAVSMDGLHDSYRLTLDRSRAQEVADPIDAGLLQFLFGHVAQRARGSEPLTLTDGLADRLDLADVARVAHEDKKDYASHLEEWGKVVATASDAKGYSDRWSNLGNVFAAMGLVDAVAGMLILIDFGLISRSSYMASGIPPAVLLGGGIALIVLCVIVLNQRASLSGRSPKALEVVAKLEEFTRWTKGIEWQVEPLPKDARYWLRVLEASVALGTEAEVARQLRVELPDVAASSVVDVAMRLCEVEAGKKSPIQAFRDEVEAAAASARGDT